MKKTSDDNVYKLERLTSSYAFFAAIVTNNHQIAAVNCSSSNVWTVGGTIQYESTGNKVTSLSAASTDTQYPSAKCVYDGLAEKSDVVNEITIVPSSGGFLPNKFYKLGTLTGTYTFDLSPEISDVYNEYMIDFVAGSPAPSVTWPQSVAWFGGSAPTITAGKHYQISIVNSLGVSAEF